jgi:hypothetical protein
MEGLALSGEPVQLLFFISEKVEFVNRKEGICVSEVEMSP